MGDSLRNLIRAALLLSGFVVLSGTAHAQDQPTSVTVDCAAGQTVSAALASPGRPLRITVFGTCSEHVIIARNDVTVRSTAGAAIVGPNSSIDTVSVFADRVMIEGLSIRGGKNGLVAAGADLFSCRACRVSGSAAVGIVVFQGAQGIIENSIIENNATEGIAIVSGVASVLTSTITGNGTSGIVVVEGGQARIGLNNTGGTAGNTISNNVGDGIHIGSGSEGVIIGTTVSSNRAGISVADATVSIRTGNAITTNRASGIDISSGRVMVGPTTVSGNAGNGIRATLGTTLRMSSTIVENNAMSGVSLDLRSTADIFAGFIRSNQLDGIVLRRGSGLSISTLVPPNSAIITANSGFGINCFGAESSVTQPGTLALGSNAGGNLSASCSDF